LRAVPSWFQTGSEHRVGFHDGAPEREGARDAKDTKETESLQEWFWLHFFDVDVRDRWLRRSDGGDRLV
jgi:hypothetical protein